MYQTSESNSFLFYRYRTEIDYRYRSRIELDYRYRYRIALDEGYIGIVSILSLSVSYCTRFILGRLRLHNSA